MKGLYDISVLFKIFKRFEKVVLAWKFGEKWAKIGKNGCPGIPIYTLLLCGRPVSSLDGIFLRRTGNENSRNPWMVGFASRT